MNLGRVAVVLVVVFVGCGRSFELQPVRESVDAGAVSPVDVDCGPPALCRTFHFDAEAQQCVAQLLPDGTACATECLTEATCLSGTCVGVLHDGEACGESSPCQPAGVCAGATCEQPPAAPLSPVWTYDLQGRVPIGHNFVSPEQHLFFIIESTASWAVSLDADGHERFAVEVPTMQSDPDRAYPLGLVDDLFMVATFTSLHALRTSDGSTAWSVPWSSLQPLQRVEGPGGVMAPMLKVFRADDGDVLLVWQSDSGVWFARLAHADGQTLQLTNPGGRLVELGPSMSEQGALLIPFATRQSVTRLSAYDQMGGLLWSRALEGSRTADASYGGHTVVGIGSSCSGAGEVLDSATGAPAWDLTPLVGMQPVMNAQQLIRVAVDTGGHCGWSGFPTWLQSLRLSDGQELWRVPLTSKWSFPTSLPVLTAENSVLVAANRGAEGIRLVDVSLDGAVRYDCALPTSFHWGNDYPTNLVDDRLVLFNNDVLRAFSTKRHLAAHGWVLGHGNPGGTHRALP